MSGDGSTGKCNAFNLKIPALRIVLLGGGNLAYHLSKALSGLPGYPLVQIWTRSPKQARALGVRSNCAFTHRLHELDSRANLYILCVSDDSIGSLAGELTGFIPPDAAVIHTSGSKPSTLFKSLYNNYGVLYPLQTFSKQKKINFSGIPLFITASNRSTEALLSHLAHQLSQEVRVIQDSARLKLHLAAVLVNNFTNYIYTLTDDYLQSQGLDLRSFYPLIEETLAKLKTMKPAQAQTGPARRHDKTVIDQHLSLLKKLKQEELQTIYRLFSTMIWKKYPPTGPPGRD